MVGSDLDRMMDIYCMGGKTSLIWGPKKPKLNKYWSFWGHSGEGSSGSKRMFSEWCIDIDGPRVVFQLIEFD